MSETKKNGCFVDSNVWLYAFMKKGAKATIAQKLVYDNAPVVSTQVINETCRNLIRKAGFSDDQIEQIIITFYNDHQVISLTQKILLQATQLRKNYSFSFWDSLIVSAALESGVALLYSEDMQDGLVVEGCLKIVNPFVP